MTRRYRLQVDLVIPEASEAKVIDLARHQVGPYAASAFEGASQSEDGPIRCVDDALVELIANQHFWAAAGVQIDESAIRLSQIGRIDAGPIEDSPDEASELYEFEPSVFLCRWPNGDFSLVRADTRLEALVNLDEFGGASPDWLVPMESCMVDFRLNEDGEIELQQFGEETDSFIWERCYPALRAVLAEESQPDRDPPDSTDMTIKQAVEHERTRLWNEQVDGREAPSSIGIELTNCGRGGLAADRPVPISNRGRRRSRTRCYSSTASRKSPQE
jgi:hypothetical protein